MRRRVVLAAAFVAAGWGAAGAHAASVVRDGHARFEVLSPTLIRLEYAEDDRFEDRSTLTTGNRPRAAARFTTRVRGGEREIRTSRITLRWRRDGGPFSERNLTAVLRRGGRDVRVHPRPGAAPRQLGGWRRSLDLVDGPVPLHPGVLSRDGWHVLDDSATVLLGGAPPGFEPRPARTGAYQDLYLFAYGDDYPRALRDLRRLTGPAPLLPRKAFGVWFSRYWPYGEQDFRDLLARFRAERVPLDTLSLDTDFKAVHDPTGAAIAAVVAGAPGEPYSWNGWAWNPDKYPDPERFVRWAHEEGIELGLNVHPSINSRDPQYADTESRAGRRLGADDACRINQADPHGECRVFDWTRAGDLDAYFALHDPFERQGIDFWWLDWCCDASAAVAPGLTPDTWINRAYALRQRARGERWPAFSRIGGSHQLGFGGAAGAGALAEHRHTIQFTGDTCATWPLLRFASAFTAAAASIGQPYVSHDIGTFHAVSPVGVCDRTISPFLTPGLNTLPPDMYARWVQLGAFQPLDRLHSHHGRRLPWEYEGRAGAVAAEFLRLREALVPYLYALAREAHDTGLPMARALYLQWPQEAAAYDHDSQYTLGRDVLVAPVSAPGDPAPATVWLPPGTWFDWFTGERIDGPRTLNLEVPLDRMPLYVRAGGVVVTQPYAPTTLPGPPPHLELTAYPGTGQTTVYDDAGDGLAYERGFFARTTVTQRRARGGVRIVTIGAARGRLPELPARRSWEVRFRAAARPRTVTVAGRRTRAWTYDARARTLVVRTGAVRTRRATRVVVGP